MLSRLLMKDGLWRSPIARSLKAAKALAIGASERGFGRPRLCGPIPGRAASFYSLSIPGLTGPALATRGEVVVSGVALDLATGRPLRLQARLGWCRLAGEIVERPDVALAFRRIAAVPEACGQVFAGRLHPGLSTLRIEAEDPSGGWVTLVHAPVVCARLDHRLFRPLGTWRYRDWRARERCIQAADAQDQRVYAGLVARRPRVTALIEGADGEGLRATLASLAAQTFPVACIVRVGPGDGAPSFPEAIEAAEGEFVLPLRAGDALEPDALYHLAALLQAHPGTDLAYADEESPAAGGDVPFPKPDWSPDTLETFDCIGAPALYRTARARGLGARDPYDLALRVTERTGAVRHLPKILCRRPVPALAGGREASDMAALAGRLARTGRSGRVAVIEPGLAGYALGVTLPTAPLVSIVIPTAGRDLALGGRTIDLVGECVRGIRERSTYANLEFVTVVNPDLPPAKERMLRDLGCRLVRYEDAAFNVARKLNLGAAQARGEYLLLLNDDIAVIAPDWIERLLEQAVKPHVGVVGARLLYPDGTLQHAGVVLLRGTPLHVRRGFPGDDLGPFLSTAGVRNYSAVTGACMMARAADYAAVGGYCEDFPVHFNDVDFCLKLRRRGLHVVYAPGCRLYHYESASRRPNVHPQELGLFQARWAAELADDPFYGNAIHGVAPPSHEVFPAADLPAA